MKKEKDNPAPKKEKQEHAEDILLELFVSSASLGFIGRLLIDAERVYDSVLIGKIVEHYTALISEGLTRLQGELH
ncbi:MAG: hypothetical protein D3909_00275 [Candidatus Electrothrix sp. ATG1]|nr:hypothetical protein [Candidatus Electrothrix sp. ATG1]WPD21627.1 MAG: hypothetical protein SD837_15640 [Candidatus Electrothrix sp. GW3-3]